MNRNSCMNQNLQMYNVRNCRILIWQWEGLCRRAGAGWRNVVKTHRHRELPWQMSAK